MMKKYIFIFAMTLSLFASGCSTIQPCLDQGTSNQSVPQKQEHQVFHHGGRLGV